MLNVAELVCPACGAANNPKVSYVRVERGIAECSVCSCVGVVSLFQPQPLKEK